MAYRLVGSVAEREVELVLDQGRAILGSGSECELRVEHPTVSRRHAELAVGDGVEVLDLGSRNGTYVDGARVHHHLVSPGSTMRFGQVELRLERVDESEREAAISFELPAEERVTTPTHADEQATVDLNPFEDFAKDALPHALGLLAAGADLTRVAQSVGGGLFQALPTTVSSIRISTTGEEGEGLLFTVDRDVELPGDEYRVSKQQAGVCLAVAFSSARNANVFSPLLEAASTLLVLARSPRAAAPVPCEPEPVAEPEPASVVAELRRIYHEAARVARTDVGILVCGESGTGKEVLARFIHRASHRADGPFVALNCAALPRDLLESELFGIERGVATGVGQRAGKFELADRGTLFLDEIGDMGLETQAMILRTLQEGEVYRVGAASPRRVSVRIVAATNKDIHDLITGGRFREDLFYRIATWIADLPPLRHRTADIPNLAAHFLAREAGRQDREVGGISRAALEVLVAYDWPGNIRQLENEMARAVAFVPHRGLLESSRLSPEIVAGPSIHAAVPLTDRMHSFERREIARALRLADGDTAAAAEILGMPRSTLYRRMKVLGLDASGRASERQRGQ